MFRSLLIFLLSVASAAACADSSHLTLKPADTRYSVRSINQLLDRAEAELRRRNRRLEKILDYARHLPAAKAWAQDCASVTEKNLQELNVRLKSIDLPPQRGPTPPAGTARKAPPAAADKGTAPATDDGTRKQRGVTDRDTRKKLSLRKHLTRHIQQEEKKLAACRAAIVRAEELIGRLGKARRRLVIAQVLEQAEAELKRKDKRLGRLENYLQQLPGFRGWAHECISQYEEQAAEYKKKIDALGTKLKGESAELSARREALKKNAALVQKKLADCRLVLSRSTELSGQISRLRQALLTEELFARGPGFLQLLRRDWPPVSAWVIGDRKFVLKNIGVDRLRGLSLVALLLALALALGGGILLARRSADWLQTHEPGSRLSGRLGYATMLTLQRYGPYLVVAFTAAVGTWLLTRGQSITPFIALIANGLVIVVSLMALINLFLQASLQIQQYNPEEKRIARLLARRTKILVLLVFIGYLMFSTILTHSIHETVVLVARAAYGLVLVLNLIWIVWLIGYFHRRGSLLLVRVVLTLVLVGALVLSWMGYRNLSLYVISTLVGTSVALGICILIADLLGELFDSIDQARGRFAARVRSLLGVKADKRVPGLVWIRFLATLAVWAGFISLTLIIWRVPETYLQTAILYMTEGFLLGSFRLVPLDVLQTILVFALLLVLNGWFKRKLEKSWLPKTTMTRGARESIATVSGYVGIALAIIIALGVMGVDFTKLAIIAGALSVGIGFGLQNIVNNFVSGLILLFERPIKTGDWIVVGDTEGYVKRISIRSTHIQTFDRADVIVPNSELISGKVTNWMLRDKRGRIRVPIGVAYGSDVNKVTALLLQVAEAHPKVIRNPALAPEPVVIFIGFGASSLDFELRCYIQDINDKLLCISDLNYAIDAIFREHGIEIPFPQRDIHLKTTSAPPLPEPGRDTE